MRNKLNLKAMFTALIIVFGFACSGMAGADTNVSMSDEFLAGKHEKNVGAECSDCHGESTTGEVDTQEVCLGCHEQADIEERGEKLIDKLHRNPHKGHYPDLSCSECHKGHEKEQNFCDSCHSE